jgi:rubredoxin
MKNNPEAWKEMEEYNRNDVVILEKVYDTLKPWIKDHANLSLYAEDLVCPNCGSGSYQRRGFAYTKTAKYPRFQCTACGNWFRGGKSQAKGPEEKFVNL